jgi:MOSC domain-containing protein YiiM
MVTEDGRVVAVCTSPAGGVPKYPQEHVAIGTLGAEGDYHAGPINRHKKTGDPEPNRRQLTLVAEEVIEELNARLGIELKPGDLAENVLISGLGDLSHLEEGDRLALGLDVVVEVTAQNRPCSVIEVYHPRLVEELTGRRGVAAVVVSPGTVRPGDRCSIARSQAGQDRERGR